MMIWPTHDEIKAKINAMTQEERRQLVYTLTKSLNEMQTALIAHGDKVFKSEPVPQK